MGRELLSAWPVGSPVTAYSWLVIGVGGRVQLTVGSATPGPYKKKQAEQASQQHFCLEFPQ